MTAISSNKKLTCLQTSLLILFVLYWFIIVPLVWFAIKPSINTESSSSIAIYALIFFAVYIALSSLFYCCFQEYELKRDEEMKTRVMAASCIPNPAMHLRNNVTANGSDAKRQHNLNPLRGTTLFIICNDKKKLGDNKRTVDYIICVEYW
uniref:PAB-dependent poly(A)-specific ribonuclease subunit PAN2 n=1 Tax=Zeugodacus cucurbitae TaxID=28588 RepID=A0A0A1XQE2_ZEUCU